MASASTGPCESFTGLLARSESGDHDAYNRLIALVYSELRRIAIAQMRRERAGHTLQPTALINEAFLRLAHQPLGTWNNKSHFLATAARLMRRILVDQARARTAAKRGGVAARQITLTEPSATTNSPVLDLLVVNQLLEQLCALDPRQAEIVELHFFGGLSFDEIAMTLNISARTAKRDWTMARAWLHSRLDKGA